MNTLTLIQDGSHPLIWMSADKKLRVLARRDTLGFDEDFYKSLSSDDFVKLQKQVDEFGLWVIDLEENTNYGKRSGAWWSNVESIGGIMPDDDYTLLDAAQEHFELDKYKPLGLFNWNKQNSKTRFAETMQYRRRQKYTDKGEPIVWQSADGNLRVVARPDDHFYDPEDFYGELSEEDISAIQKQIDTFGMWIIALEEQDTDGDWEWMDNIGGIIPDDDYTLLAAAQEHFELDKYKPLGLFNWDRQNAKTRFAENIPFTPQYYPYPWEEIELVDLDEETLREIFIEMLDDTGKTDALIRDWNRVSKLPQDKPDTITDIVMAHNKQELIDFILEEQPQATTSFGLFNWNTHNYRTRFAENFSAPFMDVTFQDTPMQVKHLYHGQHTVDGVEITPHSPYWTTDLALALGHALFGAEQEVAGADLLICSKCDGTHLTSEGEMCYSCDEKGYVLQETFTDDILPQTTPLVLSLDFTEPQTVYFTQDMEHDEGVSYLVQNESFNWSFVPAETLLALLYTWLDTGLPELVEFDTGAGYVEHESSVTKRIQQAIQQLEQSAH